jgi:hypothetical protein
MLNHQVNDDTEMNVKGDKKEVGPSHFDRGGVWLI